jgi:hypothetical protein
MCSFLDKDMTQSFRGNAHVTLLLALLHVYEKLQDVIFEKKQCMPHAQPFFKRSCTSIQWKAIQAQLIGTYKRRRDLCQRF